MANRATVTIRITANAAAAQAALAAVAQSVNNVGKVTVSAGAGTSKLSGGLATVAKGLLGVATAYAAVRAGIAVMTSLISLNTKFEQTMQQVRATVEQTAGFSVSSFKQMEKEARRLGATTIFTATEAAQGLLLLSQAGFSAEEASASLEPTLRLAQAGALDLAEAARISSTTLRAFGAPVEDMGKFVDVFARTAASSATDVTELGWAMKYAAPLSAGLGRSLEETAAGIAVLSNRGYRGSTAGTGLRMFLVGLTDENSKAVKRLKSLGISFDDINPKEKSLMEITQRLAESTFDVSDAYAAFGARGGPAAAFLVQYNNELAEYHKNSLTATGSSGQMAATMDNSLAGSFKRVMSALEELGLQMGDGGLRSAIREISEEFGSFLVNLGDTGKAQVMGARLGEFFQSLATMARVATDALSHLWDFLSPVLTGGTSLSESGLTSGVVAKVNLDVTSNAADTILDIQTKLKSLQTDKGMSKITGTIDKELGILMKKMKNAGDNFSGPELDDYTNNLQVVIDRYKAIKHWTDVLSSEEVKVAITVARGGGDLSGTIKDWEAQLQSLKDKLKTPAIRDDEESRKAIAQQISDRTKLINLFEAQKDAILKTGKAMEFVDDEASDQVDRDLEAAEERVKRANDALNNARNEAREKYASSFPEDKQIGVRLRMLGLDGTDDLSVEIAKLEEKAKIEFISEEEVLRLDALLSAFGKIYDIREKLNEQSRKEAEEKAKATDETDAEIAILEAKLAGNEALAESLKQQYDLAKKIKELEDEGVDNAEEKARKIIEGEAELSRREKDKKDDKTDIRSESTPFDNMVTSSSQEIGGGGGFAFNPIQSAVERTATTNEQIRDNTAAMVAAMGVGNTPLLGSGQGIGPKIGGSDASGNQMVVLLTGIRDLLSDIRRSLSNRGPIRVSTI
jgi:TP901 family phage tail tape measure protein